ncbi:hypothetical protein F5Y08DRAFT_355638 [Xylaria arbuscula]|nr:hypothetical protein F5Y08DRAFT_355638 [Xylaria arbuscula]
MATSLSYHVESGSCPNASHMNRDLVYKIVRNLDPGGAITKNLIDWPGSTQYEATDRSYNPECQVWECFICHKPFKRLESLNQHLSSPVPDLVPLSQPGLWEGVHFIDRVSGSPWERVVWPYSV